VTDAEACDFPEARTLLSARTVDLAASEEVPSSKADSESGEVTPRKGANILRHFISSVGPDEKPPKSPSEN
jgi:hypothetical protein